MLINSCDGLTEESIRKLSHEELIQAVLRMFKVEEIECQDWLGPGLLIDKLADAFRNRL